MNGPIRNRVNHRKLPNSKWTAVRPVSREKHFLVVDWVRDEDGVPTDQVQIEAVLTNVIRRIDWRELEDGLVWRIGWR
jgi:tryptophan-rich hypothetical protein